MKGEAASNHSKIKTPAAIAGAGAGTILLAMLDNVPDSFSLKKILVLSVPTISVCGTFMLSKLMRELRVWWNNRTLQTYRKQLETTADKRLKDPHTSPEHKNTLIKKIEEFQQLEINSQVNIVKAFFIENNQVDNHEEN